MNMTPCTESESIAYAAIGRLADTCPTQADVRALIDHIGGCERCQTYWVLIATEQNPIIGSHDKTLFPEDGSKPWEEEPPMTTPVLPPPSSR